MSTVTSQTLKLFNKNNLNKNLQVTVNNNDVGISSGILPINLYCEHLKVYQTDGLSSQNLLQDIDVIRKDNILLRKDLNLIISKFNAVLSNDKFPEEWVSGNYYGVRTFVTHDDKIYILCNTQLTSNLPPSNNNSGWIPVWDSNKSYSPDTVVFYENKLYTWFSYEELSPLNISPSLNIMTSLGNVWFNLSVQMWSSTSTYSQSISLPFVLYYGGLYGYKASTQSIVGSSPITDTDDWVPIWSKSRTYSNGDILIARNGIFAYTEPNINSTRGVEPVNGEDGWNCIFPF